MAISSIIFGVGCTSRGAFQYIRKKTGVLNSTTEVINHEIHSQIIDKEGNTFFIYADIDRWERDQLDMETDEERPIRKMCREMKKSALSEPFVLPPNRASGRCN